MSFEPPISICDYVCEHIESLCPEVVDEIRIYFENNKNILAPLGLTMINCSNTGEYLPPFHQNCCTNLDIKICKFTSCVINAVVKFHPPFIPACTKGNGQVLDSHCVGSEFTPSPTHMPSTASPSLRNEGKTFGFML